MSIIKDAYKKHTAGPAPGAGKPFFQPKLSINSPDDAFEKEADAISGKVMQMEEPQVQLKPLVISTVQSKCEHCEEEDKKMQRKEMNQNETATDNNMESYVAGLSNGGGQSLSSEARNFYEPRFGYDFSNVKVHTDNIAAKSAQSINALAYTSGNNIVFNSGQFAPNTDSGKKLLGHELTHVVQQGNAKQQSSPVTISKADPYTIQRSCGTGPIATVAGTHAGCGDNFDGTFISGNLFKFNRDCDEFAPGQEAALVSFVNGLPATTNIELHSYASVDGDVNYNKDLGCARMKKAQSVIVTAGFPASRILNVVNHGPVPGPASDRRSVVVRTSTAPAPVVPPPAPVPLTVTMSRVQSLTSPAGMPDRIPPRVDTAVAIGISGFAAPMLPVTLSVDGAGGGNGTVTIDGAASVNLSASAIVNLRGVDQTDVGKGGNLKLVAKQGVATVASSNNFSVSSIGQNHSMVFSSLITGADRGMFVTHTWQSDSGVVGDLDKTDIHELVEIDSQGGSLSRVTLSTSGYLGEGTLAFNDRHSSTALKSSGFIVLKQTQMFKDNRTGAIDIPMRNSGYRIGHFITAKPGTGVLGFFADFEMTSMKFGSPETALSKTSGAGRGSERKVQNI